VKTNPSLSSRQQRCPAELGLAEATSAAGCLGASNRNRTPRAGLDGVEGLTLEAPRALAPMARCSCSCRWERPMATGGGYCRSIRAQGRPENALGNRPDAFDLRQWPPAGAEPIGFLALCVPKT
jgi:hypothetical protein